MSDASIAAIVVTYDSEDDIEACLAALRRSTMPLDVVVVDNGSRDRTVARAKSGFPEVTVIEQDNLGYAGGNNRGLRHCGDRYAFAFIVNPDVVIDPSCVERLHAALAASPRAAIACAKTYYSDGRTICFAGATIDWENGLFPHRGDGEVDSGQYDSIERIERAYGAAMLVRMSAVRAAGFMPEDYFLYFEEVAWSLRLVAAGFDVLYVPTATCVHDVSSSIGVGSPLAWYYSTRNSLLFMSRHGRAHWKSFRAALRRRTWREARTWLRHPSRENLIRVLAVSKAFVDYAVGRFGRGW